MTDTDTETDTDPTAEAPPAPQLRVLRGQPTDAELAALIAVLGCVGGAPQAGQPEKTRWGLPVDNLRFAMSNYQRLTMQQISHLRH